MDGQTLKNHIIAHLNTEHHTGEGAGGSGHMVSIGLGRVELLEWKKIEGGGPLAYEALIEYDLVRESEFGGESTHYKKKILLDGEGRLKKRETLECRTYDLLTGKEINYNDFDFPEL